ncbi:MAG: hypothetical protein PHY02_03690 [Phycisphaerae bacterium]|nr:hypothetical protein [Phycisphaerae bacterium]
MEVIEAGLGVSFQKFEAEAQKRRIGKFNLKIVFCHIQNPAEIKAGPIREKPEIFIFTYGGISVIGTCEDTFITAKEMSSDFGSQVGWEIAFIFYCQIADALIGIKLAIGPNRPCRAGSKFIIANPCRERQG